MKRIIAFSICSVFTIISSAQIPLDSLLGTYAGQRHDKIFATASWVIAPDTLMLSAIDTANCIATINLCGPQHMPLASSYTYCITSSPVNYHIRLHSIDSLTAIADSSSIQPPCINEFSVHFYGKRISNDIGIGINDVKPCNDQFEVYPNPSSTFIFVESKMMIVSSELQITDLAGKEIKRMKMNSNKMQVDIRSLSNGIYFLNVLTENGKLAKKIVVQR